jgi:FRG domain
MSARPRHRLASIEVRSWSDFEAALQKSGGTWIFRGQARQWPLSTSLERALLNWHIDLKEAPVIEHQMIRDFRRRYKEYDRETVRKDTLYCMSVMQHYGAPTRLLDFTYSPYIAAKFALEQGGQDAEIWCISAAWLFGEAKRIAGKKMLEARGADAGRSDKTFLPIYMSEKAKKFAFTENSYDLNERLTLQRGLFMCPGDVRQTFEENLFAMREPWSARHIVKLRLRLDAVELRRFANHLLDMNVNSAVLFPGVDGFARALSERLFLFQNLAKDRTGLDSNGRKSKKVNRP